MVSWNGKHDDGDDNLLDFPIIEVNRENFLDFVTMVFAIAAVAVVAYLVCFGLFS